MAPPAKSQKDVKLDSSNPWNWIENSSMAKQFGLSELLDVYRIRGYSECHYKKRPCRCKKNPYCLWGLGDIAWRGVEWSNGIQEELNSRDKGGIVGLQNLGATCYVNSLLQLWFHNPLLRTAILCWKPPTYDANSSELYEPNCSIGHLQMVFAKMKISKQKIIATEPFVTALKLNAGQQQDAQEFAKLLYHHILATLENDNYAGNEKIKTILKTCFAGISQFHTTCEKCKAVTVGREEEFNELQLSVLATLEDAFLAYFQEERLVGDNQYFCNNCQSKQDAVRGIKLLQLPKVLNIQLMRFCFDASSGERKKVLKNISFPEVLDMTPNVLESRNNVQPPNSHMYQLNAVLIHNGSKATSGHYISHIKDLTTGQWFECNDARIEKIDKKGYKDTLALKKSEHVEGETEDTTSSVNPSSRGAYMLVYTRQEILNTEPALRDQEVPDFIFDLIKREETILESQMELQRKLKLQEEISRKERQQEIDLLFKEKYPLEVIAKEECHKSDNESTTLTHLSQDSINGEVTTCNSQLIPAGLNSTSHKDVDKMDFISTVFLEKWLMYDPLNELYEIENEGLLCCHMKLKPPKRSSNNQAVDFKIIPSSVADRLYEKYRGIRLSGHEAFCNVCVSKHRDLLVQLNILDKETERVIRSVKKCEDQLDKVEGGTNVTTEQMKMFHCNKVLIGKDTLRDWKKYAKTVIESDETTENENQGGLSLMDWIPNRDLQCEHGSLNINHSIRKRIDDEIFLTTIVKYFPNAGLYSSDQEECKECLKMKREKEDITLEFKQLANQEKSQLHQLYKDVNRRKTSGVEDERGAWIKIPGYYSLVSEDFISEWAEFIRNPSIAIVKDVLNIHTDSLLCSGCCENPGFKYPFDLIESVEEIDAGDFLNQVYILRDSELAILLKDRTIDHKIRLKVTVNEFDRKRRDYAYEISDSITNNFVPLHICHASASDWVECILARTYAYEDGDITVRRIDDDEEMPPLKMPRVDSETSMLCGLRRSERKKRTDAEKTYHNINSSMRIRDLQVRLIADFGNIFLSDQCIYWNGRGLTDDEKRRTFGELRIPKVTTIYLKVRKNNLDEAFLVDDATRTSEVGFAGSALLGFSD